MSDTYPTPEHGWTCFHCGENFPGTMAGQYEARLHFGKSINDEPRCQISAFRVRSMEYDLRRYREEDSDLHREIARLKSEHATALQREEEKGYARGLKDYQALEADHERTKEVLRNLTARTETLVKLLEDAKRMAEFGDINEDMEDDGIGWKQWYKDVREVLK